MQKKKKHRSTLSRDIGNLLLQRMLGMQGHIQLKRHDNTVASTDV